MVSQPPQTQPTTDNYVPQPGVIEQNEMFDFALKSAPNVLYARFKQFGQVCDLLMSLSHSLMWLTSLVLAAWRPCLVLRV